MEWLSWTETLVGHLAWPLTTLMLGFGFRRTLVELASRMKSAKYGDVEFGFSQEVRALQAQAEVAEIPPLATPENERHSLALTAKELRVVIDHLAPLYPTAAVFEAWRAVEAELKAACERVDLPQESARKATDALRNADYLSSDAARFIHRLRSTRNSIVHADCQLSTEGAYEVAQLAERALGVLTQVPVTRESDSQAEAQPASLITSKLNSLIESQNG